VARATYVVKEYSTISEGLLGRPQASGIEVDLRSFQDLVEFIEENETNSDSLNAFSMFRAKGRRHIKVKNHVGVIETRTGCSLEILPKIYASDGESEYGYEETKLLFLRMLAALKESPFLDMSQASLKAMRKFPLLEIFIAAYLTQVESLLKRELRGDYQQVRDSLHYVKGKVLVAETMRRNVQVKAEVVCEYDVFTTDISPNRLIKSTLRKLLTITSSFQSKKEIHRFLSIFASVSDSNDFKKDFAYCQSNVAHLANYGHLILWSELYLENKGLTNFKGSTVNQAILFPMEKVFEQYIGHLLTKYADVEKIELQHSKHHLLGQKRSSSDDNFSIRKFRLKPDFVLNDGKYILDTKWKMLNSDSRQNDITESDVYQMHAYGRTFQSLSIGAEVPRTCLIYPCNPHFKVKLSRMRFGNDLLLDVVPFDLANLDLKGEVKKLIDSVLDC
jgi:5-methylcytosine-specific restriction enzyme subunit McrC